MKKFLDITNKSLEDFEVKSHQELWNKVKGEYNGFSCELPVAFEKSVVTKENGEEDVVYTMVFSTSDEDRHGDIVMQDFDLKWYKKNPVLLDSHNYDSITHIIGKVNNIRMEDGKLKGEVEFNLDNPKGLLAKQMVEKGFLNASSIGFLPKEFDDKGRILKSELLENSLVSVPANARALFEKEMEDIETTDIESEEVIEETPEQIVEEKIIETKLKIDHKKVLIGNVLKALEDLNKDNLEKQRRQIFKAIKSL